jgi:hypothetical protein
LGTKKIKDFKRKEKKEKGKERVRCLECWEAVGVTQHSLKGSDN